VKYEPKRLFSVDEANRMLPLVRRIVEDIVRTYRSLTERFQHMERLWPDNKAALDTAHREELEAVRAELEREEEALSGFVQELTDLGVELKGADDGLVDFPSMRDGRIVYLCWKVGESEIAWWHELDAGFRGRQPLARREPSKLVPSAGATGRE
jgi:hypothetical protein